MKNSLKSTFIFALCFYFCFSFIRMQFNPMDWGNLARLVFVISCLLFWSSRKDTKISES